MSRISEVNLDEMEESFNVNLFSSISLVQKSITLLRESRGFVIAIGSGAAKHGYSGWMAYCWYTNNSNSQAQSLH